MQLYSVKQTADQLKVTTQTIYKRLRDKEHNAELMAETQTDDKGVIKLTKQGVNLLGLSIAKTGENEPQDEKSKELIETLRADKERLQGEIERLNVQMQRLNAEHLEQLKVKDQQIDRTLKMNENSQVIINSMQQQQMLLTAPGRKGFFSWLKKDNESEG